MVGVLGGFTSRVLEGLFQLEAAILGARCHMMASQLAQKLIFEGFRVLEF